MVPISALPSPCSYRAPNLTTSITASLSSLRLPQSRVVPPGLSWPCFSSFGLRHTACRGPNAVAPAATANTLTPAAAAVLAAAASRLAGNSNAENISASAHHTTRQGQGAPTVSSPSTSQQQQQQQQQSTQPQAHLEGRLLRLSLGPLPLLEQRFTVGCCPTSSAVSSRLGTMPQGGSSGDGSQQAGGPGAHTFKLVAPVDVDEVMDMYIERGLLDSDPYWTRAWPSAIALATTILSRPDLVRGKRVADLGAGLGVAGIAAALAGASEVVLLDREPLALQCALMSASATLGSSARIEGLQLADKPQPTLSGAEQPPSSSAQPSSLTSATSYPTTSEVATVSATPTGPSLSSQSTSHLLWPGPIQSFAFHGPDLARYNLAPASPSTIHSHDQHQQLQETQSAGLAAPQQGSTADTPISSSQLDRHHRSQQPQQQPLASSSPQQPEHQHQQGLPTCIVRAAAFDWNLGPGPLLDANGGARFDVVLACDVLYEEMAVEPIARLVPRILRPLDGLLLLADPPSRTAHNRERFLCLLTDIANSNDSSSSSQHATVAGTSGNGSSSPAPSHGVPTRSRAANLVLEECSIVDSCRVAQLDPEMAGGLASSGGAGSGVEKSELPVPVQLVVCRSTVRGTVGLKLPSSQ